MENKEVKRIESLGWKCKDCYHYRFDPQDIEEDGRCTRHSSIIRYYPKDALASLCGFMERRRVSREELKACSHFLDRRACSIYARIRDEKKILGKIVTGIVELRSKGNQDTEVLKEEYRKRLGDLNEEIVSYNKIIKGISPIQNKKK